MSDRDQFTFDDDDDFPEADLSAAFSEGEHTAEEPVADEPDLKTKKAGNARTRILLMVLLLVVVGGAGAYYFMGLGGTTPSVPTVPVPVQRSSKSVALPPQPAQAPEAQVKPEPTAEPVSVTVPPPPPVEPAAQAAPAKQPAAVVKPPAIPVVMSEEKAAAEQQEEKPAEQLATQVAVAVSQPPQAEVPKPAPAPQQVATALPAPPAVESAKPLEPSLQAAGGVFALDAGSYLLESNRNSLVAKIRKLGYEPLVTQIDATLDMTRLRLGTFSKDEVQEALDFARSIEAGAYSAPAGDRYVIYAGTFLKSSNIDTLSQRFLEEGIKVYPEPVQVVRTLNRIRFGSFTTKEEAAIAAQKAGEAGLQAVVVKSR